MHRLARSKAAAGKIDDVAGLVIQLVRGHRGRGQRIRLNRRCAAQGLAARDHQHPTLGGGTGGLGARRGKVAQLLELARVLVTPPGELLHRGQRLARGGAAHHHNRVVMRHQKGMMAAPRGTHRGAGGEGHGPRVEQLRASQIHGAIGTAGDEHAAVIEQRGREALARHGHLADQENGAGGRIEHFGRVQHDVAVRAAHYEHAPAAELAGRMALARRGHRAVHQREGVALGIENFKRRRSHAGGLAAGNQKALIGERGDGGADARFAHGQDRRPGIGGGIVELGCVGGGLARDAAASDQHLPAGERRANVLATRHAH